MSGAKHTPGPWRVVQGGFSWALEVVAADERRVAGPFITSASNLTPADGLRRIADAHLVAAAPDLLEALRGLVEQLGNYMSGSEGIAGWNLNGAMEPWGATELEGLVEQARAAIARATGGAA